MPAYHHIEVKVARRGTHVLYRRGYTTRPESAIESKEEFERRIQGRGGSGLKEDAQAQKNQETWYETIHSRIKAEKQTRSTKPH